MKKILVIDDEASMCEMLGIMLRKEGFHVQVANSRAQAGVILTQGSVDLVITDVKLPDGDGIEVLRHLKSAAPETIVIVMTAYNSTETAVAALKLGAHDYLIKPFDVEELKIVVRNALEKQRLEEENLVFRAEFEALHGLDRMIGTSPAMVALVNQVRSVAPTGSTILITGESGTGKELVAKAIHALSPRRDYSFVSANCGAFPETLLESELFGHMKGAFTDAHQTRKGLFETAHRGTLFLDEVGDMPPAMQVKLLRTLQERTVRRVGASEEVEVDVRLITATNRPLPELVRDRRFREDLFYRLNVIPLRVPPLRERKQDIPLLAEHFVRRFSRQMGKALSQISAEAMARLTRYSWPGNVRELENVIERAVALENSPTVLAERLPETLLVSAVTDEPSLGGNFALDAYLQALEAGLLRRAMAEGKGDRSKICQLLGVTPRSLRYLIKKHSVGVGEEP